MEVYHVTHLLGYHFLFFATTCLYCTSPAWSIRVVVWLRRRSWFVIKMAENKIPTNENLRRRTAMHRKGCSEVHSVEYQTGDFHFSRTGKLFGHSESATLKPGEKAVDLEKNALYFGNFNYCTVTFNVIENDRCNLSDEIISGVCCLSQKLLLKVIDWRSCLWMCN